MPAKGEFEIEYFGGPNNPAPCGGVNYSAPYTALPPNDLAPGSVNLQNINGFLSSSPWVAQSPYNTSAFVAGEFVLGVYPFSSSPFSGVIGIVQNLIVTNVAVYLLVTGGVNATQLPLGPLTVIHTWSPAELPSNPSSQLLYPGQAVSFVMVNSIVYFTGLMLNGIFGWPAPGLGGFFEATNYVAGRFIGELAGRLVVAECRFPGGGGTGITPLPTIAWSGVGIFGQAWDLNPAHDVWNPANQAFFSGNIGGFNLLGDVPDQITGIGTVGQSMIIVRQSGLTQQDPNSSFSTSGVQPYVWYHMWASPQGVGGYVGTVAQYGQTLVFRSDDNIYSLSLSTGLSTLGNKIIPKIIADQRVLANSPGVEFLAPGGVLSYRYAQAYWNFASIYNLDGQLHYVITLSTFTTNAGTPTQEFTTCVAYDLNMSDGSWNVWDFSQYFQQGSQGAGFIGFSCPISQQSSFFISGQIGLGSTVVTQSFPMFILFGAFTSYGALTGSGPTGTMLQLVPFDYDFNSNPISNWVALLYAPLSVPSPTIIFRGETVTLGHHIIARRLRLQADNAPMPTILANAQQQSQATFTGAGPTETTVSVAINMAGNAAPVGQAIRTYYGDTLVNSETIQPSLTSVFSSTNPWQSLCAFRIASASLIGNDATGTQQ